MLASLIALALAPTASAEPVLMPSADPFDGETGVHAAAGGGASHLVSAETVEGAGWFRVEGAPVERLVLGARGVVSPERAVPVLSASYAVLRTDAVAIAPFVVYQPSTDQHVGAAGLAFEAGTDVVRVDLSLPIVQVGYDDPPLMGLVYSEAGLSVEPIPHHELRAGVTTVAAWTLRYRGGTERIFVEAGVGDSYVEQVDGGLAWLGLGARL